MTRFARAKGSKSSNERVPESATSWSEMKEQLATKTREAEDSKNRKGVEAQRNKNYQEFLDSQKVVKNEWSDFSDLRNGGLIVQQAKLTRLPDYLSLKVEGIKQNEGRKNPEKKKKNYVIEDISIDTGKLSKSKNLIETNAGSQIINNEQLNEHKVIVGFDSKNKNLHVLLEKSVEPVNGSCKKSKKKKRSIDCLLTEAKRDKKNEDSVKMQKKLERRRKQKEKKSEIKILKKLTNKVGENFYNENKETSNEDLQTSTEEKYAIKSAKKFKKIVSTSKVQSKANANSSGNMNASNEGEQTADGKSAEIAKKLKKREKLMKYKEKKALLKASNPKPTTKGKREGSETSKINNDTESNDGSSVVEVESRNVTNKNRRPAVKMHTLGKQSTPAIKKPKKIGEKIRRKPEKPNVETLHVNGRSIDITYFDGFPVRREDGDRLLQLRKQMISKGLPRSEINRNIQLERRRAEKALTREKKKVCFHCRTFGHNLAECPKARPEETEGTGICFKCGSTEHTHFECKIVRTEQFKFATCFICREPGHIAKQCPDNARGVYPQGGCCNVCGAVTHLKKDCPQYQTQQKTDTMNAETIDGDHIEALDISDATIIKPVSKKINVVKF